jgi:hypothetical protein
VIVSLTVATVPHPIENRYNGLKTAQIQNRLMTERRQAAPTVKFVDEYCQWYQQLFPEVRSDEKPLSIFMWA